ncbi:hypothetical protein NHP164001_06050 [Helicobacter trogontum]|uniref:DUF2018 family protein n=1 Tax=Helicobacter trogontum TaxID=50960 RepID=A0ABQ0D2M0_9HELI
MEILSEDENVLLLVRKDDKPCLINLILELLKVCNEGRFKNEDLLLLLENMDEEIKKAYLKLSSI